MTPSSGPSQMTFAFSGMTFDYLEWEQRVPTKTVLLLHGFPQPTAVWLTVAGDLHAQGFRVVALAQRGYSRGASPLGASNYRLELLGGDVVALLDHLGASDCHVVGHDWGGAVAWVVAARHPQRVATLTILSMPHPSALPRALVSTAQAIKSWYVNFFMVPGLIELLRAATGDRLLIHWLAATGLPTPVAQSYVESMLRVPGGLTAALNWYRAAPWNWKFVRSLPLVSNQTIFALGDGDVAVDRRAAALSSDYVNGSYEFVVLEGVSHLDP